MNLSKLLSLAFIVITLMACRKEKSWSTTVEEVNEIGYYEATVAADFKLARNDNYVFVGVCWSTSTNPEPNSGFKREQQLLDSDRELFYLDGLSPNETYYVRSYIQTKDGDIIYSEDYTFKTTAPTTAPCFTEAGIIEFNSSPYVMADLSESTIDGNYQLSTNCSFGELHFIFSEKPSPNLYKTVTNESDLFSNKVSIYGILGIGWTCYYGVANYQEVFVDVREDESISITFCEVQMSPTGSCEGYQTLFGEVQE